MNVKIEQLRGQNFRCFSALQLEEFDHYNVIVGPNGAGKTSLLESIYVLGSGHSFRSNRRSLLCQHGYEKFALSVSLRTDDGISRTVMRWQAGKLEITRDQQPVASIADLAQIMPVQAIGPWIHELISGGPEIRRRFLNWGLFHRHQDFYPCWRKYCRALHQRNAALQQNKGRIAAAWEPALARLGEMIHALRQDYVRQLQCLLESDIISNLTDEPITLHYRPGWSVDRGLARSLDESRHLHVTVHGPHRAELLVLSGNQPARGFVSRGQERLIAMALGMAQALAHHAHARNAGILLIDDLSSELDESRQNRVLTLLRHLPQQLFITDIHSQSVWERCPEPKKLFHCHDGTVSCSGPVH